MNGFSARCLSGRECRTGARSKGHPEGTRLLKRRFALTGVGGPPTSGKNLLVGEGRIDRGGCEDHPGTRGAPLQVPEPCRAGALRDKSR